MPLILYKYPQLQTTDVSRKAESEELILLSGTFCSFNDNISQVLETKTKQKYFFFSRNVINKAHR